MVSVTPIETRVWEFATAWLPSKKASAEKMIANCFACLRSILTSRQLVWSPDCCEIFYSSSSGCQDRFTFVLYQSDYVRVNGNVIMSGCGNDNPDDERREAARSNTESVSRGTDGGGGRDGDRSQ